MCPYIEQKGRNYWDPKIEELLKEIKKCDPVKGDINYIITKIVDRWGTNKPSYTRHSDVRAVLADVRDEYTRRRLNPYEDKKRKENGDVY